MATRRADTPQRVTRAASKAPAPLPAVETKQSHAYGARGKAALDKQTTNSTAAIDDAFATSRQVTSMPPPPRPAPSKRQPKQSQTKEASPDESLDQDAEVAVNGNVTQSATEMGRPRTGIHGIQYITEDELPLPEPNKVLVFVMTAGKFLQTKQFWLCLTFSWLTFTAYVISAFTVVCANINYTATLNTTTEHVCYYGARMVGQDPRTLPLQMADAQVGLNQFVYHTTKDILGQFATVNATQHKLSTEVHELSSRVGLHDDAIAEIQSTLPTFMVVIEKDGKVTIPDAFWQALAQKMNSNDDPTLWEGFLDANQANLQTVMSGQVTTMVDGALATQKIVTSQQLEAVLKENNHMLEETFNGTLRTFQAVMLQQMKTTAQEAAKEVFDSSHLAKGTYSLQFSPELY